MMNLVIAYDIRDPRRLLRIAKIMEDYGTRVQRSIFEAHLPAPVFRAMRLRVEEVIAPEEDGVKYFHLCRKCMGTVEVLGLGEYVDPDAEVVII
jgi:CRISPR-associated protein Cas2